ncbi:hypothetical protein Tco_1306288, partial [Tanacetum coccineum]
NVLFRGMLIPDAFLTDEIRTTDDYVEYETVFVKVVVSIIQPRPIVSTQRMHRTTHSAYRSPTLIDASLQIKKIKSVAGETSSPRKLLKVTIKQRKQSTTLIPPPIDDKEMDEITEATLLSLALHKTAIAAEAQENVAKIQENLKEGGINKMVEGVDN